MPERYRNYTQIKFNENSELEIGYKFYPLISHLHKLKFLTSKNKLIYERDVGESENRRSSGINKYV